VSTEQGRIDAHRAAVMAWVARIPSVLVSPDGARTFALTVVSELLAVFGRPQVARALEGVAELLGEAIGLAAAGHDLGDIRRRADLLASRHFVRHPWTWEERIPYEVCEALRRACEEERLLCTGAKGKAQCGHCDGKGREWWAQGAGRCPICDGRGWVLAEPVAVPILATLLHDAHALLCDLRADTMGLERLVDEAERRARATKGSEE